MAPARRKAARSPGAAQVRARQATRDFTGWLGAGLRAGGCLAYARLLRAEAALGNPAPALAVPHALRAHLSLQLRRTVAHVAQHLLGRCAPRCRAHRAATLHAEPALPRRRHRVPGRVVAAARREERLVRSVASHLAEPIYEKQRYFI